MEYLKLIAENYEVILSSIVLILTGVIGIAMILPGEQPEKFLKKVVEFIEKFSKK